MIRRLTSLFLAVSLAGSPAAVRAGGVGTTAAPFLKVPVNARAVAMGGAYTAVPGDVTSLEYNPAGIAALRRTDIAFTYIDYLEDTSFQSAAVAFPFMLPGKGRQPEPPGEEFDRRRMYAGLRYNQFKADDDARNEVGIKQGSISIQDQLIHLGFAYPVRPRLAVGGSIKSIRQKLDNTSASTMAFDVGAQWLATNGFRVGASLMNLGSGQRFEQDTDPLPTLLRVGVCKPVRGVLLAADAARARDSATRLSAGAEWSPRRIIALRAGVVHQDEIGLTTGLGFMFAGPQKAAPALSRRTSRTSGKATELVFNERRATELLDRLNFLAADLTEKYEASGRRPKDTSLAVLPASGAGERMGPAIADLLGQQFYQQETFPVEERSKIEAVLREVKRKPTDPVDDAEGVRLGRMLGVRAVVISEVTKSPSSYNVHSRIVSVDEGNAVAASTAVLPADVFSLETRPLLGSIPSTATASGRPGRMDLGLDYGLSTQGDLGLTHTLTLRILY